MFALTGHDPARVTGVSTDDYYATTTGPIAPRPRNSILDTTTLENTGYTPAPAEESLKTYVRAV